MTQSQEVFPYYRSPAAIRGESFSHRMRGLDEEEVREYLDTIADQVAASDQERETLRSENERLRRELEERPTSSAEPPADEISPQAVALFSQAQQVADQLVEEAVQHARDLMTSARNQQREILEEAHRAAEQAAREAAEASGQPFASAAVAQATRVADDQPSYSVPIPEVEYVRTFAKVAQVQLRSVLDALTEQVDKLGEVPELNGQAASSILMEESTTRTVAERSWRIDSFPAPVDERF